MLYSKPPFSHLNANPGVSPAACMSTVFRDAQLSLLHHRNAWIFQNKVSTLFLNSVIYPALKGSICVKAQSIAIMQIVLKKKKKRLHLVTVNLRM